MSVWVSAEDQLAELTEGVKHVLKELREAEDAEDALLWAIEELDGLLDPGGK